MNIHWFQHVPFEGLGSIAAWALKAGHRVTATRFHRGEAPPRLDEMDWLFVMGGPMSVHEERAHPWLAEEKRFVVAAIAARKRVLGVCLGAQLIADALGARVYRSAAKEIGWFPVRKTAEAARAELGRVFPDELLAYHWHGETFDLPAGAVHLARSAACEHQAFALGDRVLGLQYHLEMTPEAVGELVRNCTPDLVPGPYVQTADAMLADPPRCERSNAAMDDLLEALAGIVEGAGR